MTCECKDAEHSLDVNVCDDAVHSLHVNVMM